MCFHVLQNFLYVLNMTFDLEKKANNVVCEMDVVFYDYSRKLINRYSCKIKAKECLLIDIKIIIKAFDDCINDATLRGGIVTKNFQE